MDVAAIISSVADAADDFLAGVASMTEARPVIREYLQGHHPGLSAADTQRVVAGLLSVLDEEGFFEAQGTADSWSEGDGSARAAD